MSRQPLAELGPVRRHRALVHTALAITIHWVLITVTYYLAPFGAAASPGAAGRVVGALLLLLGVLTWQVRRIKTAELPGLRAIQALAVVIPLFLAVFAAIHLSLSRAPDSAYNVELNHTQALYFTVTVFATVGFGDITPTTDTARLVVTLQMLLDLVLLGAGVRVLTTAAKMGLARRQPGPPPEEQQER